MRPSKELLERYKQEGRNVSSIAEIHNVSLVTVYYWYKCYHIKPFRQPNYPSNYKRPSKETLEQCTMDKLNQSTVAKKLGVTRETVRQWYNFYGLEPYRPPKKVHTKKERPETNKITTNMIVMLHEQGLTPDEIRNKFNARIARTTILRRLKSRGLKPNRKIKTYFSTTYEMVRQLHSEGLTCVEMYKNHNLSVGTVYKAHHVLGLTPHKKVLKKK